MTEADDTSGSTNDAPPEPAPPAEFDSEAASDDELATPVAPADSPAVEPTAATAPGWSAPQETTAPPIAAPTQPIPAFAPAWTPTVVVEPTDQPPAPTRRGGVVAWVVAGVLAVAAIVLAVLWVGASGDADDAKDETAQVASELQAAEDEITTIQQDLDTAQSDLEATNAELEQAQADNEELTTQVEELTTQVDDLQRQLDEALAAAEAREGISERVALELGRQFGFQADPPLTDPEATCVGNTMYEQLGFEFFVEMAFVEQPSDEQLSQLFDAIQAVETTCGIGPDRLGIF